VWQSTEPDAPAAGGLPPRRKHLLAIAIAAGVVLTLGVACTVGAGLYLWNRARHQNGSAADAAGTAAANPAPKPAGPPTPKTGAACLPGIWRETSSQADASIDGVSVRLNSSGAIQHFYPDGSVTIDYSAGISKTGTQNGNTYTVTSTGTMTSHYQVVGNQIVYSDYQATGTTVWLRNGKQIDKQDLKAIMGADTFTCTGGKLVEYADTYSMELVRIFG
jgi:hypothetical protein